MRYTAAWFKLCDVKRLLRALVGIAACTVAAASTLPTFAVDDWMNLATVSMTNATTPKLIDRYVCYTDGKDVACTGLACTGIVFGPRWNSAAAGSLVA